MGPECLLELSCHSDRAGFMPSLNIIILAAGDSTRLKSKTTKVLHPICGRAMIEYVLSAARGLKPKKMVIVVGNGRQALMAHLSGEKGLIFAHQKE
jgi:bifunctional UDP-N-acetylglucosamine pyrophosphorylase/glucosamine-1-phosphate N-acetyltransferase